MNKDFTIQQYYDVKLREISFTYGDVVRKITYHYPEKKVYVEPIITDTKLAADLLKKYML